MNRDNYTDRKQVMINTSGVNIIGTLILATVKVVVGLLSDSMAMIMDAVNYYNDVVNAAVILIGAVLSDRKPDRKHPFGYGRVEYLSSLVLSMLFLYTGVQSMLSAVRSMLHPSHPHYSVEGVVILAATLVIKYFIGKYTLHNGKAVESDALCASGGSQIKKAGFTLLTMAVIVIYMITDINLDAYLGVVIAFFIMKGALKLLQQTISNLIGRRQKANFSMEIKKTISSFDQVIGAYDLVLHNYGPVRMQGSVHIEIPDTMTLAEYDTLQRHIVKKVLEKHDVLLTAIGCYAVNNHDEHLGEICREIRETASANGALSMHGFYLNESEHCMSFDVVYDIDNQQREIQYKMLKQCIRERYPDYQVQMTMDLNFSD
ncbi:MAG: cation diffusion facilitator family transporter [Lachnospiraceae bacterium]